MITGLYAQLRCLSVLKFKEVKYNTLKDKINVSLAAAATKAVIDRLRTWRRILNFSQVLYNQFQQYQWIVGANRLMIMLAIYCIEFIGNYN